MSLQTLPSIGKAVNLCFQASMCQNHPRLCARGLLSLPMEFWNEDLLGGAWELAFLTSSSVVLTLLAWGPYLGNPSLMDNLNYEIISFIGI